MPDPQRLLNRNFVLLWQGQLVSQLGNQAFLITAAYTVMTATGSATMVGAAMIAATVPVAVLGPVCGTFVDRHSRRTILVSADLVRAVAIGALGLFLLSRPDVREPQIAAIIAAGVLCGACDALFTPAFQALLPDLVPSGRLAAANSIGQMSRQTSTLVGQMLGGLLYVQWGAAALLLFDAFSFVYAAMATSLLPRDERPRMERHGVRLALQRYGADTRAGLTYVWRDPGLSAVLAVFATVNCLFMPVFVLLPFHTREVLDAGPEWYGFLLGAAGAGALGGSAAAGRVLSTARSPARLVRGGLVAIAGCVLLLAASRSVWLAAAALAGISACASVINVAVITSFQSAASAAMRGRVMALVVGVSTAAVPIGMAIGGILGDLWRGSLPLVFAASGLAIAILAAASARVSGFSAVLDRRGVETRTATASLESTAAERGRRSSRPR